MFNIDKNNVMFKKYSTKNSGIVEIFIKFSLGVLIAVQILFKTSIIL